MNRFTIAVASAIVCLGLPTLSLAQYCPDTQIVQCGDSIAGNTSSQQSWLAVYGCNPGTNFTGPESSYLLVLDQQPEHLPRSYRRLRRRYRSELRRLRPPVPHQRHRLQLFIRNLGPQVFRFCAGPVRADGIGPPPASVIGFVIDAPPRIVALGYPPCANYQYCC
jgi:hypothetical protein